MAKIVRVARKTRPKPPKEAMSITVLITKQPSTITKTELVLGSLFGILIKHYSLSIGGTVLLPLLITDDISGNRYPLFMMRGSILMGLQTQNPNADHFVLLHPTVVYLEPARSVQSYQTMETLTTNEIHKYYHQKM